ncbi:LacI family DNA-binding transcriptional regulator [Cellulomonas sp. RIT-PI-Y]|jgi:DNA-binding LacI/PurR family transcriptional regulator|uniref:LacI family DNA-binding transcriptional regulator n=1 Tax=Cellulomonas sp. RIT-PI-Y TaxID=3035297 RepID=UPI0021DB6831|nr:LacI family DNA-binding transcriptional regulator [Cellulomonas sp. RIT-PI-Y]
MATIDEVAKAAGVSASTVSYVLSGKRPISPRTRERVERTIRDLGYRPHAGARALASSRSNIIALMVPFRPGINVQIIMQFVGGVVTAARAHDHDVLLLTQDDSNGVDRVASSSMADAIIVMDVEAEDERLPALRALKQPSVLIGVPSDPSGLSCVDLDFTAAGRSAVRTLTDAGHRRLALIGASQERIDRRANYAIRMRAGVAEESELRGAEVTMLPCDPHFAGGVAALERVLDETPGVTGLVVHNELALPGVMSALERRGVRVPEDISVVAIGAADTGTALPRPLTGIDVPGEDIGRVALEMAMAQLEGDALASTRLVSPQVTDRGSVTPPTD